ncbi:MAG TPA: hypothetical protein VM580_05385 [Labilithrix sp.]|nr:hypothetical protein [Labilithrix sp.]
MTSDSEANKLEVRCEPDTGFIYVSYPPGVLSGETARLMIETITPIQAKADAEGDPTFILSDVRQLTGMSPEARKVFAGTRSTTNLKQPQSYIATFGGGFAMRALATIVGKGLMLVAPQLVLTMAAAEHEARAWLTKHRRAHFARKGSS